MTANDSKSYLPYLNRLVDQYNNQHFIGKKPITADYSLWLKKNETICKVSKFNVNDSIRITKYKNNFNKAYTEN